MAEKSRKTRRRSNSEGYWKQKLPIEEYETEIVKAINRNDFLVIVGETGSGKTTQLPQFLHRAGFTSNGGRIGITQPRRIAAISVATRVAEEMNCTLGGTVGYQVRFDDCTSDRTFIKYMTDGCLLREFLDDAELRKYEVVILDEAHERSLDTDILFGLVKQLFLTSESRKQQQHKTRRPPKIVVMSATLNHQKFSHFLGKCPVFEIPGRCFPVKEVYSDYIGVKDLKSPSYVNKTVDIVMSIHLESPPGDVLVFLTGQEEIEHTCDKLFEKAEQIDYRHDVHSREVEAILILPLYGSMTTDLQKRVFEPTRSSVRKVVVATNIAATSLTIEGIRFVVDNGFVKQLSYNARTGLDSLNVVLISRSEAIQRAGRAGRTASGKCFRLYTREVFESSMLEDTIPEIQRTSLTRVVLHLKSMGIHDVLGFQYIDPPEEKMLLESLRQLYFFEALDREGHLTTLGRRMIEFPLIPGLARAVIHSGDLGCEELLLPVAAMLSVENVFTNPGGKKMAKLASQAHKELADASGGTNDFATLLYIYKQCQSSSQPSRWCREHYVHWRALKMASSVCQQLEGILHRQVEQHPPTKRISKESEWDPRELLRRALCGGFFCNVARRHMSGKSFRTMDGHATGVFIHPSSALFGCEDNLDWIIFHDIIWTSKIYVKTVCPIRYEWVKDLLPRLHEVDVYSLSGWAEGKLGSGNEEEKKKHECDEEKSSKKDFGGEGAKLSQKRNTDDSLVAARERFLLRKKARNEGKSS